MNKFNAKEYLDSGGTICPYCGDSDIGANSAVDVDEGVGIQVVSCNRCNKRWTDIYRLVNVQEV